jgi:uncharacterized membrane protein YqhA
MPLAGNLMLIVIFPVTKNSFRGRLPEICRIARPGWARSFSALELKLVSSIVAISAIALLRAL